MLRNSSSNPRCAAIKKKKKTKQTKDKNPICTHAIGGELPFADESGLVVGVVFVAGAAVGGRRGSSLVVAGVAVAGAVVVVEAGFGRRKFDVIDPHALQLQTRRRSQGAGTRSGKNLND